MAESGTPYQVAKESLMNRIAGEIILSRAPGDAMRKWRALFELSQSELAKIMKIAPSVLSDYEKNRRKSPGTVFVKRFVMALVEADERKGGAHVKRFSFFAKDFGSVILDIAEFTRPRTVREVVETLDGVLLAGADSQEQPVFGYTVVESLNAIRNMDAMDFLRLFGSNSMRALVFVGVTRGRSPMVAVKIYPIKPRMVVIHGPPSVEEVDKLGVELAERENIPFVLSLKHDTSSLIEALRKLA